MRIFTLLLPSLLSIGIATSGPEISHAEATNPEVTATWSSGVFADLALGEYEITAASWGLQAPNRSQDFRTLFREDGIEIVPRDVEPTSPSWRFSWKTEGWGREGSLRSVASTRGVCRGSRIEYVADGSFVEWYENRPEGLKQGFRIGEPPVGTGRIVLRGRIPGALRPVLSPDGAPNRQQVDLIDPSGTTVLTYGGLQVYDATGNLLPSGLVVGRSTIQIWIDDSRAVYPIEVDPLLAGPSWEQLGGQQNANFGGGVATAGDVNGDGFSDVLVGAPLYDSGETNEGRVYLYLGGAAGLSSTPAWIVEGDQEGALFGHCVAPAGDVNGDGYDDVIIGAPNDSYGQTAEGRAFVYLGSGSGLSTTPVWFGEGNQVSAGFGYSAATAGDVNGDGYSDIVVGAFDYDNGQTDEGMVYLYYGSASGVLPTPAWSADGDQAGAGLGIAVAPAGDVDGDGYSDIIVGAYRYDNGATDQGRALVYKGSSLGIVDEPIWIKDGVTAGDEFGHAVGPAGDVDGDGYADIVVGAPRANGAFGGPIDEGRAYLFRGSSHGPSTVASWTGSGAQENTLYGWSVGTAGDLDGDGFADVIIGAYGYENGQTDEGRAYVYQGSLTGLSSEPSWLMEIDQAGARFGSTVASAGDVDGDGFGDVIVAARYYDAPLLNEGGAWVYNGSASGLAADPGWSHYGTREDGFFGASVSCAGDVDGDGYSDVLVSSPMTTGVEPDSGWVFLFRGRRTGLPYVADWSANGEQPLDLFGHAVSGAGDVNGDGYSDVIVGASQFSPPGLVKAGRAYVYHGSPAGLSSIPDWVVTGDVQLSYVGTSVSTAGDVNGDGYSDVLVGASGAGANLYLGSPEGLSVSPAWHSDGPDGAARFGDCVSTAGDVNGDGYSDVIIGAPAVGHTPAAPGQAFVYLGSITGLADAPAWTGSLGQPNDWYGDVVSTAGDVNGDGFDDIVVGAELYEETGYPTNSGAVVVYLGSASGIEESIHWIAWGSQDNGNTGSAAGTAGDVNGDGYSDIAFGSFETDLPVENSGSASVKLGSASGLSGSPEWTVTGEASGVYLGSALGTAGDVDGDGYDDLIVGGPGQRVSGITHAGSAYTYLGNARTASARGLALVPRQMKIGEEPIDLLGMSDAVNQFRIQVEGRSAAGRGRVRLEWNVAELGSSVSFAPLRGGVWSATDLPSPGIGSVVTLTEHVSFLTEGTDYHWRMRVAGDSPFFPHTPWMSMPRSVPSQKQLRTGGIPSGVGDSGVGETPRVGLDVVRPNPFTGHAAIVLDLPQAGFVDLSIFDPSGRRVRTLVDRNAAAGRQVVRWDGRSDDGASLASGVYFARLRAFGKVQSRKVVLTR